jgi:hypothetical protein
MKKLFELQKRIKKADLLVSGRQFVKEASVDMMLAPGQTKTVKRVLFLVGPFESRDFYRSTNQSTCLFSSVGISFYSCNVMVCFTVILNFSLMMSCWYVKTLNPTLSNTNYLLLLYRFEIKWL